MKNIRLIYSLKNIFLLLISFFLLTNCKQEKKALEVVSKPNILFIGIDDLRLELGAYGNTLVKSPHIDRLAKTGMLFTQAHCQVPVCGASRASLLTGLLPTTNRFLNYATAVDKDAPNVTSLPANFKNNGYHSVCLGKIFHYPNDNESASWSEPAVRLDWNQLEDGSWSWEGWHDYQRPENIKMDKETGKGPPYENADVPDNAYTDGQTVDMAVQKLEAFKDQEEPFFLAVGILKPHLPFNAPQKYWDLYNKEEFKLPVNYHVPENVPKEALFNWGELRAYEGVPEQGPVSDSMAINLIHGYYASVSYADALVGRMLDALDDFGLAENTIVVLWSDHGYFLGEHSFWTKHALFELSINVPLIIRDPKAEKAMTSEALVDLVDVYPTLCDLANLEKPTHLQGKSFHALFDNPTSKHRQFSYTRFKNGESIKDTDFRYTQYFDSTGMVTSDMLYDHKDDPAENGNVVSDNEYTGQIEGLKQKLGEIMQPIP